jgi:hypothetical protein
MYIVRQSGASASGSTQVVVATQPIPRDTPLSPDAIRADVGVKNYPANFMPTGAYIFTTENTLLAHLSGDITNDDIVSGDILLTTDPRCIPATAAGQNSL